MALRRPDYLIVSCEHGGNRVPSRFRKLFSKRLLDTHRGYDPGALAVARDFAAASGAKLFYSTVSRLLVELNRPLGHPQVFSVAFPETTREELLRRYYFPYWNAVEARVARARRVLHLSCHSFTPKLAGVRRLADVGLLFDRVRYNYPYRGASASLVASLREKFSERRYVGIQIEINQKFPRGDERSWRALRRVLLTSFQEILKSWSG